MLYLSREAKYSIASAGNSDNGYTYRYSFFIDARNMFNLVIALFPKGAKASKAAASNSGKIYTLGGDLACINWVIFAALSAVKMHIEALTILASALCWRTRYTSCPVCCGVIQRSKCKYSFCRQ